MYRMGKVLSSNIYIDYKNRLLIISISTKFGKIESEKTKGFLVIIWKAIFPK